MSFSNDISTYFTTYQPGGEYVEDYYTRMSKINPELDIQDVSPAAKPTTTTTTEQSSTDNDDRGFSRMVSQGTPSVYRGKPVVTPEKVEKAKQTAVAVRPPLAPPADLSDLDSRAAQLVQDIADGATFHSPTYGDLEWGENNYRGACSTGSYNILWRLGLPKVSDNLNVDQKGDTLTQMGLEYIGDFDAHNPVGYTPQNGDTAVFTTFTRDRGKNRGKKTQHQQTYLIGADGKGHWYSDTKQLRLSPYQDATTPKVKIYRIKK